MQEQIKKAIGAHGLWKTRLQAAIESGTSEATPAAISADDACDFGKWLYGDPGLRKADGHFEKVRKLHAEFHTEVGRVLSVAVAGKRVEALKLLDAGSAFARLSGELTREMLDWSRSA